MAQPHFLLNILFGSIFVSFNRTNNRYRVHRMGGARIEGPAVRSSPPKYLEGVPLSSPMRVLAGKNFQFVLFLVCIVFVVACFILI